MYVDPFTQLEYSGLAFIFSVLTNPRFTDTTPIQDLNATLTADGLFAVIPSDSAANEVYWFFTEEVPMLDGGDSRDGWEARRKLAMEHFKDKLVHGALRQVEGEWGSFLKKLVIDSESVKFYPIFRLPLSSNWFKGRALLLGDAAHAMQPHAGQGVAMALEDVFLLSRLFQSLPVTSAQKSIRQVYTRFEELRRPRVEMYHKAAANGGEMRKRMPSWKLALFEKVCLHRLWVFNMLGLNRMGMSGSQGTLVYDIESVPLWHQSRLACASMYWLQVLLEFLLISRCTDVSSFSLVMITN